MSAQHPWIAAGLAMLVLAACASNPAGNGTGAMSPGQPASTTYVTGSLIPVPVDPGTGQPQTSSTLQIVSAEDLQNTGRTLVGGAVRARVPPLTLGP